MPAYRSYRSRRRVSRRKPRYTKRRPTRSLKRRYAKPLSKRRILNTASEKKSDTRLFYSNTAAPANPPVFAAPVLTGGTTYEFIHVPTAMDKSDGVNFDIGSYRARTDVYMRGFSETLRMTTNSGVCWNWRRIVFRMKGPAIYSGVTANQALWLESGTNGWTRTWVNHAVTPVGSSTNTILFKGTLNQDWYDPYTAPLDTNKVDVVYDKYQVLRSGNSENQVYNRKMWHAFNKSFIYNDDEAGSGEVETVVHTPNKHGMGDVYIVDIMSCANNAASNTLQIDGASRLYWHEK